MPGASGVGTAGAGPDGIAGAGAAVGRAERSAAPAWTSPAPYSGSGPGGPRSAAVATMVAATSRRSRIPEDASSAAVAAVYAELEVAVAAASVVNADETGHRTNGAKRWLWAFVARTFVLYRIAASRGADVLTAVLGARFAGVLGSDRLPTYLSYAADQRPLCWAHFTRNLLSALELATTTGSPSSGYTATLTVAVAA